MPTPNPPRRNLRRRLAFAAILLALPPLALFLLSQREERFDFESGLTPMHIPGYNAPTRFNQGFFKTRLPGERSYTFRGDVHEVVRRVRAELLAKGWEEYHNRGFYNELSMRTGTRFVDVVAARTVVNAPAHPQAPLIRMLPGPEATDPRLRQRFEEGRGWVTISYSWTFGASPYALLKERASTLFLGNRGGPRLFP